MTAHAGRTRPRHGPSRLAWIGAAAVALALLVALTWLTAPLGEPGAMEPPPAAALATNTAEPADDDAQLSAAPALPEPEAAIDAVQPLVAPPARTRPRGARSRDNARPSHATELASLDLTLLEPSGDPAGGVKLSVRSKSHRAAVPGPLSSPADGRFVLAQLPAEVPLRLRFTDRSGHSVRDDLLVTLAPGEHRVLTESTQVELFEVVVEVRDPLGRLIQEPVDVSLVAAFLKDTGRSIQTIREKTAGGRVSFSSLAVESVSVTAQLDGFAPAWVGETRVDHDPLIILLALDPGTPVDVEVVDEQGRTRDVDSVLLRGSPVGVQARCLGPGRFRFDAYPAAATGIAAVAQGRRWEVAHDARQRSARIVVPAAGAVEVRWDPLGLDARPQGLFIYSEPPGWGWFKPVDATTASDGGPIVVEDLAPGDYRFELPFWISETQKTRTGRATVRPGQVTSLRMGP